MIDARQNSLCDELVERRTIGDLARIIEPPLQRDIEHVIVPVAIGIVAFSKKTTVLLRA